MYTIPSLAPQEVLIYLRKSRADDASLSVSDILSRHEGILDEWCDRNLCARVPESNRYREVVSGETIADRPEMTRLLRACEQSAYKAVLVVEPQRLSRGDLEDIGYLSKVLKLTHTLVLTPVFSYDLNDERDRDSFERELKRGNEYLEYTKKILARGRLESFRRGCYITSTAPYGYKRVTIMEGKRKLHTLEIVPSEAEAVRFLFRNVIDGVAPFSLVDTMNEKFPRPSGLRAWSRNLIYAMLKNDHYRGKVTYGKVRLVHEMKDGAVSKRYIQQTSDNYLIADGLHEAIVTDEEFFSARDKMQKHNPVRRDLKIKNPLAGVVRCSCGYALSMRDGLGKYTPYFTCKNNHYYRFGDVWSLFCTSLRSALDDFRVVVPQDISGSGAPERIKALECQLREVDARELRLWDAYTRDGMPPEIFERLKGDVVAERQQITSALDNLRTKNEDERNSEAIVATLSSTIDALLDDSVPASDKNEFIKTAVQSFTVQHTEDGKVTGVLETLF